jgi:general secretion pathway protein F
MRYSVKVMRAGEGLTILPFDATSELEARLQAETQGYRVLSVSGRRGWRGAGLRASRFPLVLFSQELLALLNAGLPLLEAVQSLAEKEHRPEVRRTIEQVIVHLFEGRSLSQALERFPVAFPPLFVAGIRAAERTGDLPQALSRYVAYQTQLDGVKGRMVTASIYPLLLVAVGGLVTLFLMAYVVPTFSRVFQDMGGDIPLLSRLLIKWGVAIQAHSVSLAIGALALLAAIVHLLRLPRTRRWMARWMWAIPAIGERLRIYQLARFYRTLGMQLEGGIPVVAGLDMVAGLLNPALRAQMRSAAADIREGKSISRAMETHGLTTPVALRMLRVGERTGRMSEMMEAIAGFYDDEMARWVDWFTRLFEPLLMALIGVVIGVIVVLMYMPIFELAGSMR